jgi:competence protein ComEA
MKTSRRTFGMVAISFTLVLWMVSVVCAQQATGQEPSAILAEGELPAGEGSETFVRICSACHEVENATETRHTRDEWKGVLTKMVDRGALVTDEDAKVIVDYLTAHFGKELNLNKATAQEVESFLKVSAEESTAIVYFRETNGHFKSWEDLSTVPGLDVKKIEDKKDTVTF